MLETVQAELRKMTDRQLSLYYWKALEVALNSGEPRRYDPDQDPMNIDDPEDEMPSVNEEVYLRLADMCSEELERRVHEKGAKICRNVTD